jgi:uncharacterized protein (TIGR02598 family)
MFAMAILSFSILTIMGLMPSAMADLSNAERRAAESRILQSLTAELEAMPWQKATTSPNTKVRYYDEHGAPSRGPFESLDSHPARYAAQIEPMTDAFRIPGTTIPNEFVRRFRLRLTDRVIKVQQKGGVKELNAQEVRQHTLLIVKKSAEGPVTAL